MSQKNRNSYVLTQYNFNCDYGIFLWVYIVLAAGSLDLNSPVFGNSGRPRLPDTTPTAPPRQTAYRNLGIPHAYFINGCLLAVQMISRLPSTFHLDLCHLCPCAVLSCVCFNGAVKECKQRSFRKFIGATIAYLVKDCVKI